ncbi:MAG: ATP-dependent Clp protease adaptor ClpS [Lachnospiraceae bacterium]|nr:ATP-dependent Clp protease adaptor ClpS [Lachnospiraceae bacterium]
MATDSALKENTKIELKEPKHYNVIMINDDFTTMEFVVMILVDVFDKDEATAEELMMKVHRIGRAVVGTYPYDIAMTRTSKALDMARMEGFPFRMIVEETE